MNVGRKLILIVISSVALVTIPAATGIYYYAKHRLIANEGATLVAETKSIAETNTKILHEYELSLKALANTLAKSLTAAPQASEVAEFDSLIQHSDDGAWRSKHKNTNGDMETGVFLPPDASLDTQQKILHLRVKHIFDAFGSSITSDTSNIWLATLNKSEVIYDNNYPNFIFDMSADTDYSQTPWVTLGDPATNPERRLLWTPPLYDVPSKLWMISAVQPIDVSGHWIGTVGRDIALRKKELAIFKHSQRYADEQYFLIDAQGNYLEASLWQKELQADPKNIPKLLLKEPQLSNLLSSQLSTAPQVFEQEVSLQGKKYLATGMTMPVVGWHYFRLVPVEGVLASMQKLFFAMIGVVLASGLLIGLLIDVAVKRNIVNRLKLLAEAVRQYGLGQLGARANLTGDDEIAKTSREFDAMANQLESTLDAIPDILFELGLDGSYYAVHTPDDSLLVAPSHELIGKKVPDVLPTHSANVVMGALQEAHEKGWSRGKHYQRNTPRGLLWFELSIAQKSSADTKNPRFLVLSRDITDRKAAEDDLRISAIAFEAQESMMVSDANKVILRVNQAFTDITGYHADEVIGQTSMPLRSNLHDASFYAEIWDGVKLNGSWKGELYSKRKNGEVYPGILSVTAVYDQNCVITHYVTSLVDITKEKITAEEIQFLAFYDPLTGLPNRRLLVDRLDRALSAKVRNGKDGALLFIDLDHFKTLNDSLGHDVGDLLLQQVAKRLTACVRDGDTVARLGGDEYVVLLENLSEHPIEAATQAEAISAKILATLNAPYQLDRHEYHSTSSIGAALFSDHGLSQEDLLKHADIAMYQAKKAGRNTLRFFDPQMQQAIHARVDLERELRKAIEKQQFQLYYQAQTNFKGNAIGAEALIRWIHPERGLVSPFEFIPLAEETGAILAIGEWVLETACAQLEIWQHVEPIRDITLSINVSARQFRQADFSTQVQAAVERHDINPMLLKLELTESILLEDFEGTIATINALKKIGVLVSLDDFGTGYSSLQYLKRLPLQQLKIDQSFVRDILTDSSDQAIVRTIIAMAKSLELEVIAEGVETEAQRQHLLEIGCQSFQGYLFGKPMPIKEFEATFPED